MRAVFVTDSDDLARRTDAAKKLADLRAVIAWAPRTLLSDVDDLTRVTYARLTGRLPHTMWKGAPERRDLYKLRDAGLWEWDGQIESIPSRHRVHTMIQEIKACPISGLSNDAV